MTTATRADLHADHKHWRAEIAAWRDDLARWRQEQRESLAAVEAALGEHSAALKQHEASLSDHEEAIVHHEHFIAECERSGARATDVERALAEIHCDEAARHAGQREAHERIKRYRHAAVAKLSLLQCLLERAL